MIPDIQEKAWRNNNMYNIVMNLAERQILIGISSKHIFPLRNSIKSSLLWSADFW
jgi:hypothetical protein